MKHVHRFSIFPAVILLLACITPFVSAFTVSSTSVDPRGDQAAGTLMTVSAGIDFSRSGTETFPLAGELRMSTDLVDPQWVPVLVLDGVETRLEQKSGGELVIPGWYLSYPSSQNVQVRVTVTGAVPENPSPARDLLKIQEVDPEKNIVSTAHVEMSEALPVPLSVPSAATKKPTTLRTFTPIPADTPQASLAGAGAAVIAITCSALLVMRRK